MRSAIFILTVVVALAAAEAVYFFLRYLGERREVALSRRLKLVGEIGSGVQIMTRRRLAQSPWLAAFLEKVPGTSALERLLEQSDTDSTVARTLTTMGMLGLIGLVLALALRRPLLAPVAALLLGSVPVWLARRARARRSHRISEQLPDALDAIARAIDAGHSLGSSFKLMAQEAGPPIATEFAKAFEQQNLGLSLDAAVTAMTTRVPDNIDLRLFAVSVIIQKETGGNLIEILQSIAATMRQRFSFASKLRGLTAESRISGYILGGLPIALAALIALTNPPYLVPLGHGIGLKLLGFGVAMWLFGALWMRQLARVEY